jgi:hypothetical protein
MNLQLANQALRFHTTPADLETQNLLARMYGSVRGNPYFYGMGDLQDDIAAGNAQVVAYAIAHPGTVESIRTLRSAAAAYANPSWPQCTSAGQVNCNDIPPLPLDPPPGWDAATWHAILYGTPGVLTGPAPPSGYIPPLADWFPTTPPPSSPPPASDGTFRPRVVFTTSRGGTTVYPGDTWSISISGAQPGSPVVVQGGKNGAQDRTPEGTADASGNWQLSGSFTPDMIGPWQETWSAGGVQAGSFSFNVQPAPSGNGSGTGSGSGAGTPPPAGNGSGSGTPPSGGGITIGGMTLDGTTLAIAGAALVGLFFLGGKK